MKELELRVAALQAAAERRQGLASVPGGDLAGATIKDAERYLEWLKEGHPPPDHERPFFASPLGRDE